MRDRDDIEILMVQRPHTARFMPGAWVFPGGVVDIEDAHYAAAQRSGNVSLDWRVAALRELIEETGVWITTEGTLSFPLVADVLDAVVRSPYELDLDQLIYFSNWITPTVFPIRFDTRFFLAVDGGDVEATFNRDELVDVAWIRPLDALRKEDEGVWDVAFPTRKVLELVASESSAISLAAKLTSLEIVPPIQPRLHVGDSDARILMPGDPDFDAVGPEQKDPTILDRLAEVVSHGGHVPAELKARR